MQKRIVRPDYWGFFRDLISGRRAREELHCSETRSADTAEFVDYQKRLTVLDIGSGRLRPQTTILSGQGHAVVGIDLANSMAISARELAYRLARYIFKNQIARCNSAIHHPQLVCGNVNYLPFQDDSFDLITSVAAFEHFLSVDTVVREIRRVLKPGGVAWIAIHPFPCLSGGHNIGCRLYPNDRLPKNVEAWDHLRSRRLAFTVPLNEWRPIQYLDCFSKYLRIENAYFSAREGEQFLTQEVREELKDYSEEELLHASYTIVGRNI